MRAPIQLATLVLLAGCGDAELGRLEEEHAALRERVDTLKTEVGALRAEMVEAGLVADRPAKGRRGGGRGKAKGQGGTFGHPLPEDDLSQHLTVTARRVGTPPALPALGEPERTEGACGYKFVVKELQPISDYPLNSAGFGKASPVVLLENGAPLTAHATPDDFDARCAGAFRYAGHAVLFSPSGEVSAAHRNTYGLALSSAVPMPRGDDGRLMYWVYPGTRLELSVDAGWDPAWGPMTVSIGGLTAGSKATPRIEAAGETIAVKPVERPGAFEVSEPIDAPPEGRWTVAIESPAEGPYLLLGTLTVGNDEHALVVTAEEAFRAARGGE